MGNEQSSSDDREVRPKETEWRNRVEKAALVPLESLDLIQLASGPLTSGSDDPSSFDDEDDDEEEEERNGQGSDQRELFKGIGETERLFLERSDLVTEGLVLAGSRFKVLCTNPRGVLGRFVAGRTTVRVLCPFESSSDQTRELDKVLLEPFGRELSERESLDVIAAIVKRIRAAGGKLHVVEGQAIYGGEQGQWLMVKACMPPKGYIGQETEIHFGKGCGTATRVRLLPVEDTMGSLSRAEVDESLREFFRKTVPVYVEPRLSIVTPVFRRRIEVRKQSQRKSRTEQIRRARLEYFEKSQSQAGKEDDGLVVEEVALVEWRVVDVESTGSPRSGAVVTSGSSLFLEGEAISRNRLLESLMQQDRRGRTSSSSTDDEEDGGEQRRPEGYRTDVPITGSRSPVLQGDRCMRCGALVSAPRWIPSRGLLGASGLLRTRPCMVYRCPCGQPMANSQHPLWQSVERMAQSVETASRPSVMFLQELREVIGVMPLSDPRSSILHSSLRVFPLLPNLEVNFDAADNLVLMIMPSLQRQRGVDPQVLERLPVTSFENVHECAGRRKETDCSICMEPYENTDVLRTLPCFHFFHKSCIDKWLSVSKLCPICKFEVTS